jgi:branched-chain amino acid transport system permease protein
MNVINLSHGVFVITGAYLAAVGWTALGLDPLAAIPPIMLLLFAIGYVYQRLIIQPAIDRGSQIAALLATFGAALIAVNFLMLSFSSSVRSISPAYAFKHLAVAGMTFDAVRLIGFAAGIVLVVALGLFLGRTRSGRIIRATAQQELGARLCGVDARQVYALTFAVGSAFAGASGAIIGIVLPFTPVDEVQWTVNAFVVVVLGGVGSPAGALLGGLLLGVTNTLTAQFIGSVYTNVVMFLILLAMLLVRPSGILGTAFRGSR